MSTVDKSALLQLVLAALQEQLDAMSAAARFTRDAAVDEEARAENDKDTRGLEQSYLARGQSQRVVELRATLTRLRVMELLTFDDDRPIAASALVDVRIDDVPKRVFLVTAGGGERLELAGSAVQLVSTASPLGRALLGRVAGDELELRIGGQARDVEIEAVE